MGVRKCVDDPSTNVKDDLRFMANMFRKMSSHGRLVSFGEDWEAYFGKENWEQIKRILEENKDE